MVVTRAVPFDPRKPPKAPATKLPGRGNETISKYILNESFLFASLFLGGSQPTLSGGPLSLEDNLFFPIGRNSQTQVKRILALAYEKHIAKCEERREPELSGVGPPGFQSL
jgi:hypothetical protein